MKISMNSTFIGSVKERKGRGLISIRLEDIHPGFYVDYKENLQQINKYMEDNYIPSRYDNTDINNIITEPSNIPKHSGMLDNGVYIKKVIYNRPATIIIWSDGTKTSSKCQEGDIYNPELGMLLAYMKKIEGSDKVLKLLEEWAPIKGKIDTTLNDIRKKSRSKIK